MRPPPALQHPDTRAAAERTLLEFRNASRPYEACEFILQNSTDLQGQFQVPARAGGQGPSPARQAAQQQPERKGSPIRRLYDQCMLP